MARDIQGTKGDRHVGLSLSSVLVLRLILSSAVLGYLVDLVGDLSGHYIII